MLKNILNHSNLSFTEYRGYRQSTDVSALVGMLKDIPAIVETVGKPIEGIAYGA